MNPGPAWLQSPRALLQARAGSNTKNNLYYSWSNSKYLKPNGLEAKLKPEKSEPVLTRVIPPNLREPESSTIGAGFTIYYSSYVELRLCDESCAIEVMT